MPGPGDERAPADGLIFDTAADAYAAGRPGYPEAVFDLLRDRCGLAPGIDVLEIGPGAGQATAGLVATGARVTAVEPGPNLARIVGERFPAVSLVVDRFEDADVGAGAFDLAVAATSFHWVDHTVGLPKLRAALRPGGHVALLWNRFGDPDRPTAFSRAVEPVVDRFLAERPGGLSTSTGPAPWVERLDAAGFVGVDSTSIRWERSETTDEVVGRFVTHSGPLSLAPDRRRALVDALRGLCDGEFGGTVHQRYRTEVSLARAP